MPTAAEKAATAAERAAAKIQAQEKETAFKSLFEKISGTITKNPNIPGNSVEAAKPWQDLIDTINKAPTFINKTNTSGKTLLAKAIDMKKARTVKLLLQNGASLDWGNKTDTNHLCYAAASTNEILTAVLSTMTDAKKAEYLNKEPSILHAAINSGDLLNVSLIIDTAKAVLPADAVKTFINKKGVSGTTALIYIAGMSKSREVLPFLDRLLAEGADATLTDDYGQNILFRLVNEKPKMVKKVATFPLFEKMLALIPTVDGTLPINKKDNNGFTVLGNHLKYYANFKFVKYLIDKGADIRATTNDGLSLFHIITENYAFKYADSYDSIDYLKSKGLSINVQDNKMRTILLSTIVSPRWNRNWGPEAKIGDILQTGINVNIGGDGSDVRPFVMPLIECIAREYYTVAKLLIEAGADFQGGIDVGLNDERGYFPIHSLVRRSNVVAKNALLSLLARDGLNINIVNSESGCTAAHYATNADLLKILVDKGIDINAKEKNGYTPIYYAAYYARLDCLDYLKTVRAVDLTIKYNNRTLLEIANMPNGGGFITKNAAGVPTPNASNAKIIELFGDGAPSGKIWEGWSRANATKFDSIFADAEDEQGTSCCPVCLKTVVRSDGCVYIQGHNCSAAGGDTFYHKKLYEKYKMPTGNIVWCTLCGRICYDHRHYKLFSAQQEVPKITRLSTEDIVNGTLEKQGDYFTRDCKADGSGGGKREKLARFRRGREYALELQRELEKQKAAAAVAGGPPVSLTEKQALEELVEEMWNAPFTRNKKLDEIAVNKSWNIPHSEFPMPVEDAPEPEVDMSTLPNITAPAGHKAVVPEEDGDDVLTGETGKVIHFEHVQPLGGAIIKHAEKGEIISPGSLVDFIKDKVRDFKNDESFGRCLFFPSCKGPLYPDEIEPYFREAINAGEVEMTKKTVKELFEEYRIKFNWKFKGGVKGGRRTLKSKWRRRTLKGGNPENWHTSPKASSVIVPAKNVKPNNVNNTRKPNINTRRNSNKP